MERETISEVCSALGITATAYRIDKPAPFGGQTDGWHVTLKRGNATLSHDYWQGFGFREFKTFDGWRNPDPREGWLRCSSVKDFPQGKRVTVWELEHTWYRSKQPTASDVLGCLCADASGVDSGESFEDYCATFGYDTDSRRAEQSYNECQRIALQLRGLLGEHYDRAKNAEY